MKRCIFPLSGLALLLSVACNREAEAPVPFGSAPYGITLPPGAPAPAVPPDNPLTEASVRLGKMLFFDERLSLGRGVSCASCHQPDRAFSDTVALSQGAGGGKGSRNAPTLANVAYHPLLMRDGGAPTLEQQVLVPLMDSMEMDADIGVIVSMLKDLQPYRSLSGAAYGRPFDIYVLTRALASYERTLISGYSRFDRYRYFADTTALNEQERRGWAIFSGDRGKCAACHGGFDLSDHQFHNVGIHVDQHGDPGRQRITLDPADRGKFKTPTLRNIALTAPYMHDGSMATLEQVIDHFNTGGTQDPNKDQLMVPLQLTPGEKQELIAFLRSLTDERSLDQVE